MFFLLYMIDTIIKAFLQFKRIYRVIQAIKEVSGWHWDDETGASITVDTASSWDDYIKKHPAAKPFRNRGWVHLQRMTDIMPSTVSGSHVFHPSQVLSTAIESPAESPTHVSVSLPSVDSAAQIAASGVGDGSDDDEDEV